MDPIKVKLKRFTNLTVNSPNIGRFHYLGFYSVNTDDEFTDDLSQLRYLKLPAEKNVKFDLNVTSERTVRVKATSNDMKIDKLLTWIIAHRQECVDTPSIRGVREIVCMGGTLAKVMISPYEKREGWIICAAKFQGKIYLCKFDTPKKIFAEENRNEREKKMGDWGLVFEQYITSGHPKHPPDMILKTDQNEGFCGIFRTSLGHHNLLCCAEMDALKIDEKIVDTEESIKEAVKLKDLLKKGDAKFVELKTSVIAPTKPKQWHYFHRFKFRNWWVHCIVRGIDELICGYRGNDGIIRSLETFRVETLPQHGKKFWKPAICLDYCSRFLDLMTTHVSNGPDEVLWRFIWEPENPNYIEIKREDGNSNYSFLHGWYTDEFKKNLKRKADSSPSSLREPNDESKAKVKIG